MESIDQIKLKNLKRIMDSRGLNQKELAELAKLHPPSLSRILTGKSGMGRTMTRKLCIALGIEETELLQTKSSDPVTLVAIQQAVIEALEAKDRMARLRSALIKEHSSEVDLSEEEERLLWLFRNDLPFKDAIDNTFRKRLAMNQDKLPARLRSR